MKCCFYKGEVVMKFIFERVCLLMKNIVTRQQRSHLLLPITTAIIFLCYVIIIHPFLIPKMGTVPVELTIVVILILTLVFTVLVIIIKLLIMLGILIFTERKAVLGWRLLELRDKLKAVLILLLILVVFGLYTQYTAYTPPILGENGRPLEGSITTLEKVKLGGSSQWITIRGKNKNNPVLLFLAGGPGGSQLAATRNQLKALEEHFVVVNWDQPGAGKSYHAVPIKSLTPERYISDAHELAQYLCKRFNKEKIYVVGESWGSALGIWLVQRYPELFYAFAGTGQMVSFSDTEIYCYEKALEIAKNNRDQKKVEELEAQGRPPYYGKDMVWKESAYLMYLSDYMAKNPAITRPGYNTLSDLAGPEYGLYDKINYMRGVVTTFNHVYQQLYDLDLREQAVEIKVPVYFLEGRHDVNAPPVLVEEYYNLLNAPHKEFIWFDTSGHSAWINERDKFVDVMVNHILKENN
jgi:pimeloyl-ACP methyl ester carboxylesterase